MLKNKSEREKRVQLFILKNEKYILINQHDKKNNRFFWCLPGGGIDIGETEKEAAIREAFEETGLKIKLLGSKFESIPFHTNIYDKFVTFLAEPVSGVAAPGYEPEDPFKEEWEILDLKWQSIYDDDIDEITRRDIKPILEYLSEKYTNTKIKL